MHEGDLCVVNCASIFVNRLFAGRIASNFGGVQ